MSNDTIINKLTALHSVATEVWKEAYETFSKSPTNGSDYARGGATTYKYMMEKALLKYRSELDIQAAVNDIRTILDKAKRWAEEFTVNARDRNDEKTFGPARDLHKAAVERFNKAYDELSNFENEPDSSYPAASSVIMITGTTGDAFLSLEGEDYYVGNDSKQTLDAGLYDKIWDKAKPVNDKLVASFATNGQVHNLPSSDPYIKKSDAEHGMQQSTYSGSSRIPAPGHPKGKPLYIYQIQTIVPMVSGAPITMFGKHVEIKSLLLAENNSTLFSTGTQLIPHDIIAGQSD